MIELAILGFLAEQPLHGYELRTRIAHLVGHARPISDGTLYPAINRLEQAGLLTRRREAGPAAAQRHTLELTDAGRAELTRRLTHPADLDLSDSTRFFALLAFLGRLPDRHAQAAVLRRRLDFLEQPASFFHTDARPQRAADQTDLFRRGMLEVARATSRAEKAWLRDALAQLET
ncbi:PadR family transcriptional regulator [Catellatospora tritici]|uniref:PadR family transcriptional regulator n=1 Tax=Catellatospora tritici TaxID=2851566 RepID=UPI001C2D7C2F|nr:PadR family transcriptional regulator [Catellatospora tritici]MBV1855496.1 PadR family transcriptional regulator [Catellatospora tritici]